VAEFWNPTNLIEVVTELSKTGCDQSKEFEFGLDLILDGIEGLRQSQKPAASTTSKSSPDNTPTGQMRGSA